MEMVVTTGLLELLVVQSSSQIITANKLTSSFLQARCPSCRPTNSVKALNGKIPYSMDLLTPSSPGSLPTLSLTTNSSWLPWGRVAMPHISLWCQYLCQYPEKSTVKHAMLKTVTANGHTASDDTVKIAAAGGSGFTHRCQLPQLQATLR